MLLLLRKPLLEISLFGTIIQCFLSKFMGQKLFQVLVVEIRTSDIPCFLKYGEKDKQTSDFLK